MIPPPTPVVNCEILWFPWDPMPFSSRVAPEMARAMVPIIWYERLYFQDCIMMTISFSTCLCCKSIFYLSRKAYSFTWFSHTYLRISSSVSKWTTVLVLPKLHQMLVLYRILYRFLGVSRGYLQWSHLRVGECAFCWLYSHDQFRICGAIFSCDFNSVYSLNLESQKVSIPKFLASVAASSTCVSGQVREYLTFWRCL